MGFYGLMSAGNYNGEGYVPAGYTSYEKMFVGWLTPQELTRDTTITGLKPLSEHGEAFIIRNDANADEYYLLENRQRSGWDSHLPGEGLLVLHVDFDQMDWLTNRVNANPQHQRCTLVPADNRQRKILSAQDSIPYPQAGNDSLTATSLPAASVFTSGFDERYRLNKSVLGIKINGEGNASFAFRIDNLRPKGLKGDTLFYESFDSCDGKGGNDGKWSGYIGASKFKPDHEGWRFSVPEATSAGSRCALIGTSTKYGIVESTPLFYVEDGSTIPFKPSRLPLRAAVCYVSVCAMVSAVSSSTNCWLSALPLPLSPTYPLPVPPLAPPLAAYIASMACILAPISMR